VVSGEIAECKQVDVTDAQNNSADKITPLSQQLISAALIK